MTVECPGYHYNDQPIRVWKSHLSLHHRNHVRDQQLVKHTFKVRAGVCIAICVVLFLVLISRLFYLEVVGYEYFDLLSQQNRIRMVATPPPRGLILDRHGRVLAENRPGFQLEIVPEQTKDIQQLVADLGQLIQLSDNEIKRFYLSLKRQRKFEGVPLKFNLTDNEVAVLAVNQHLYAGLNIVARPTRHYPYAAATAHLVGYVGRIDERDLKKIEARDDITLKDYAATTHIGKTGIEYQYETELHGKVGYQQVEVNVEGRNLRVLEEQVASPGQRLQLTIDIDLQVKAIQAMGDYAGAVVAIEPATGEILALVSTPAYDPHLFVNGISHKDYDALNHSEYRPLINRAVNGQYPPGSTLKPFVGLAGLELNVFPMEHDYFCGGSYQLPGESHLYRDWKRRGHGRLDLAESIAESCDVYFYDLAREMGIDQLHNYLAQFGFGQRAGIDLPNEKAGLLPSTAWKRRVKGAPWYPGETLIAGIGQGFMLTTPLQLAQATAFFANHGQRIQPHLRRSVPLDAATVIPVQDQITIHNAQHWQYIAQAMVDVVHSPKGTARAIGQDMSYQIAGKTGTAQVVAIAQGEEYDAEALARRHRDHALFVAYAPAENPQIALAVIAENGGGGSSTAAPIAKQIIDFYLTRSEPLMRLSEIDNARN